jgi:hypothetical protein
MMPKFDIKTDTKTNTKVDAKTPKLAHLSGA